MSMAEQLDSKLEAMRRKKEMGLLDDGESNLTCQPAT